MGQPERSSFASRFVLDYVRPALEIGNAYFNDRPILTTFLAIFFAFSILPVLAFHGTILFASVSFTFVALAVAFIASLAVILGLSAILATVLIGASFASAFLTFVAVAVYIFFRLFVLVRESGVSGVSRWACEIKSHILNITNWRHNSSDTNESVVVVHVPEARSLDHHDDYDVKVQG